MVRERAAGRGGGRDARQVRDSYATPTRQLRDTYATPTRHLRDTYATATRLVRDRYETHSRLSRRLLGPKTIRAKKKTEVNFKCRGPVAFLRDSLAPGSRFLLGMFGQVRLSQVIIGNGKYRFLN